MDMNVCLSKSSYVRDKKFAITKGKKYETMSINVYFFSMSEPFNILLITYFIL